MEELFFSLDGAQIILELEWSRLEGVFRCFEMNWTEKGVGCRGRSGLVPSLLQLLLLL